MHHRVFEQVKGPRGKYPFDGATAKAYLHSYFFITYLNLSAPRIRLQASARQDVAGYRSVQRAAGVGRLGRRVSGPGCQAATNRGPGQRLPIWGRARAPHSVSQHQREGEPEINHAYFSSCVTLLFYQSTDRCRLLMMCVKRNLAVTKITSLFRQPSPLTL